MYNLVVTNKHDAWDASPYNHFHPERFLKHTEPHIRDQFKGLSPEAARALISFPALLMYE